MTASDSKRKPHILYRVLMTLIVGIITFVGSLEFICQYLVNPFFPKTLGIRLLVQEIKPLLIIYVTTREHFLNHLYLYLFLLVAFLILVTVSIKKITQRYYDSFKKWLFGAKAKGAEDEIEFVEYPLSPILKTKMEHCLEETMNKNE